MGQWAAWGRDKGCGGAGAAPGATRAFKPGPDGRTRPSVWTEGRKEGGRRGHHGNHSSVPEPQAGLGDSATSSGSRTLEKLKRNIQTPSPEENKPSGFRQVVRDF